MLSLCKVARGAERYYLRTVAGGSEDHLPPGIEPDGVWLGHGAEALGLSGRVGGVELAAVLSGADPSTGEVLNRAQDRVRVAGFDLTFAAPKSVSLCFALGDPSVTAQVRVAHEAAVAAAVRYLEREAVTARRGSGAGRHNIEVTGVIAAGFIHRTSRAPDPHLHTHVLVANLARGADGRWSAFDARGLYAHSRTAGFLYQSHLRHELTRRLGLEWGAVRNGMADIERIDRSVLLAFSRRSQEIGTRLETEGLSGPRAARVAALATRPAKDLDASYETMVDGWRTRAKALGLGRGELAAAMGRARCAPQVEATPPTEDWMRRMVGNAGGLTTTASTFCRRDVLRACSVSLRHAAPVPALEALADRVLASDVVEPVQVDRPDGLSGAAPRWERRWTTPEVQAMERSVVESALRSREAGAGVAAPAAVDAALSARPDLPGEQAVAVRRLLGSGAGVDIATGAASAGALDTLDAARDGWQASGLRVIGTAPSQGGRAALEGVTGIETTAPDRLLVSDEMRARRGVPVDVVVVHDAPSLDAATMRGLIHTAAQAPAKVVLIAENRQLRGVDAHVFRQLAAHLGSIDLDASPSVERPGVGREGTISSVEVVDRGGVMMGQSVQAVRQRLVADWWAATRAGSEPVMIAGNRHDLELLNTAARARLAAAGRLGQSMSVRGREMAVGDRVVVGRGGGGWSGGTRATVSALDAGRKELVLRTEDGRTMSVAASGNPAPELRHGYATTFRDAKKARADSVLILGYGGRFGRAGQMSFADERRYLVDGLGQVGPRVMRRDPLSSTALARTAPFVSVPRDPAPALARLDQELARTEERLGRARQAQSDVTHRLEELRARRAWPGRRAAKHQAGAELAFRSAEVQRWEDRLARLGVRRAELETQREDRSSVLRAPSADRVHCSHLDGVPSPEQRIHRSSVARELEAARRQLHPELAAERSAQRSLGRALG